MFSLTEILLSVITAISAGGWWISWKSARRKASGEATQSEAEGWAKMQEVYQEHIKDMAEITQKVRDERDHERERKQQIRHEFEEMRDKYIELERQILDMRKHHEAEILDLRKDIARQSRELEVVNFFSCCLTNCHNRRRVDLKNVDYSELTEDGAHEDK